MSTVAEIIERTLEHALTAAAHGRAWERTFDRRCATPARALTRSAHYWARVRHEESADIAWQCIAYATVTAAATRPEPLPEHAS